jgi:hypothetical protein
MVPIYVFQEMKLLFPKQNYNVLSPSSYTHISVRDLHIFRIGLPFLQYVDQSWEYINRSQTHECGNWDLGCAIPGKGIHKWDFPFSVCIDCTVSWWIRKLSCIEVPRFFFFIQFKIKFKNLNWLQLNLN